MNRNKIIKIVSMLFIIITIIITGVFVYNKNNQEIKEEIISKEKITPLLYEVTKKGSTNKMYLFGSIHAANTLNIEFPKYVVDAYNNSHYLACEFNVVEYENNQDKILEDTLKMMYQDNTTLKDHLSNKVYEKIINLLKSKYLYSSLYEKYRPFFLESLISLQMAKDANINSYNGIDEYFIRKAIKDKKTILEVESSDYQLNMSISFPDELYNLILEEAVDEYDKNVDFLKKLYQFWKVGNQEEILKIIDDDLNIENNYTKDEIKMIENYNKKMIVDRNNNMTKKAIQYFNNNQDVFFMVGTAHIISETGLVNNLEKHGFSVKLINSEKEA